MTLVVACRDVLRVIRAQPGAEPEDLEPVLDETEILSGKIDVEIIEFPGMLALYDRCKREAAEMSPVSWNWPE